VSVPVGSAVSGGKIYVPSGYSVSGAGSYTWEVDATPPTMPTLDASSYETKITSYDALVPGGSPSNKTYGGTTVVTLTGNTITGLNITVQNNAVIKGYGTLAAQRYIYLNNTAVISPEGGAIVLTAGWGINVANSARVRKGAEMYSRSLPVGVMNNATVEGSLLMSRSMISVIQGATVSRESTLYAPATASTIIANSAKIGGSIIANSGVSLIGGTGQALKFTGLLYVPTNIVYVNQVDFKGAMVADRFNSDRITNSRIQFDSSYLPGTAPPGIPGGGGGSAEVGSSNWREFY
ncbi:hypothetical protein HZB08_00340, partial [Candidatus Saganbacteria bacterium]|nr:hypothetical protein [Candidatus Saganbacteria bacterium]